MSLEKFFMEVALEFSIPGLQIEVVKNTGSKRAKHQPTFKITDTITSREYFIRCGATSARGWATVKCNRSRRVLQYSVLSLGGAIRLLDLKESVFVVERHIAKQRKKFQKD
jgi:hypothetical protein